MFISILYMFWAAMCPSSGELLFQCDTWFVSVSLSKISGLAGVMSKLFLFFQSLQLFFLPSQGQKKIA